MQPVANDSPGEDISESQPILTHCATYERSVDASSSCEITSVEGEVVVAIDDDDLQNFNDDESSLLVSADQPQCRICLDTGGVYSDLLW